jgi:hypothetical protein
VPPKAKGGLPTQRTTLDHFWGRPAAAARVQTPSKQVESMRRRMSGGVTILEMENIAGGLDAPDLSLGGGDIGNVIDIADSSDSLGLGMLMNPGKTRSGNGGGSGGGSSSYSVPPPSGGGGGGSGLAEVEIGGLDTVEPITLDLGGGGGSGGAAPIEIEFSRADDSGGGGGLFSNSQSASGPGFGLNAAPVSRMDPEVEKKEKIELLNKLQRLEQKGFPVSKRYSMDNTLDEMKQEYGRLVDAKNLEASIRFQRQALMSVVTGLEWANGRFDPFDLKLDGWSEAVHENVEDFDDIFEELYDKYKDRGKMPPEARLLMSLAGSGFMCHVSNSFLKSRMPSMSADDILKSNPDLARQFAQAAANQAGSGFGNFMGMAMGGGGPPTAPAVPAAAAGGAGAFFGSSAERVAAMAAEAQARAQASVAFEQANRGNGGSPMAQVPQSVAAMEPPRATARREMTGPSGVDDILRTFEEARRNEAMDGTAAFPAAPPAAMQQPATAAAIEIQSMASGDDIGSMTESTRGGRGRRRRQAVGNTISLDGV